MSIRFRRPAILLVPCAFLALSLTAAGPAAGQKKQPAWSREHAAHLLRRAGFGGTPQQIAHLAALGRTEAVNLLVDYDRVSALPHRPAIEAIDVPGRAERRALTDEERQRIVMDTRRREHAQIETMRRWWIERMVTTPRPLEEKMVLFWHGHFTSGMREVKSSRLLWQQNELFRAHALGSYRTLLLEVSKDPAMILYLNNAQNVKGRPNENYARELMELFTLGIGHYTEQDVKEAARAFTGWGVDRESGEFVFRRRQHDDGVKTVLGVRGNLNGGDVIDIILKKPRAAEHLAERLWRFFATEDAPRNVVRHLAHVLRRSNGDIRSMVRAMFMHDAFYAPEVMHSRVKSPVDLLVGTLRALEAPPVDLDSMVLGLRLMGQDLFQPPNVKGWDGGDAWINTATLYNRYNVCGRLISGTQDLRRGRPRRMAPEARDDLAVSDEPAPDGPQPAYDPIPLIRRLDLKRPEQVVDHFVERLIQRPIGPQRRQLLIDALNRSLEVPDDVQSPANAAAIRELLMLIAASPEYQLS